MGPSRASQRKKKEATATGWSERLARRMAEAARDKKAHDVAIMDLRGLTSMTDWFVIATASTEVHARAVMEHIQERAREDLDERPWHVEGRQGGSTWVLMDYVDVVLHLFRPEARSYYGLERLWGDAPTEWLEDVD